MQATPRDRRDPRTRRARTLRHSATPTERRLWRQLSQLELPHGHFRRQVPIGPYFADLAHHGLRLIVELDGAQHASDEGVLRDAARTAYLERAGYRVLRFWNGEVRDNLDGVVQTILAVAAAPPTPARAFGATRPSPPQAGGGGR